MSSAANRAKTKWNSEHYKQVKVSIDPAVAAAFKSACEKSGLSMASVLSQLMAKYSNSAAARKAAAKDDVSTRKKRRALVGALAQQLQKVRDAEESYMLGIPENLQGSSRFEAAEESVSAMDDVIDLIGDIY